MLAVRVAWMQSFGAPSTWTVYHKISIKSCLCKIGLIKG